ncbi:hypothetical protein OB919_13400 [Halobacteria archaeon AArc-curdl1]|uniref:Uncharacterized protein n=1 Tax=Natronosalvus hydrolyticus TaxID=2979988 RepID=A0AAP2Z9A5_9EURY|nr:hypothetical protein [Halobacteria archaeon AArc-curdl1]
MTALVIAFFPPARLERENDRDGRFSMLFDDEELESALPVGNRLKTTICTLRRQ